MKSNPEKWTTQREMLQNRIRKNQKKLKRWLGQQSVSCYRLYHLDIPELPLLIDWYDGRLHVGVKIKSGTRDPLENEWIQFLTNAVAQTLNVSEENVFIKFRKQGKGGTQYTPIANDKHIFQVKEGGHLFTVNLSDYLDTGLFLDHRITRKMIEKEAAGKRFLNLFAYTGSFSVYAAAGGAHTTTTVDLSNTYLDAAKRNMELNGFNGSNHRYQKDDILQLLKSDGIKDTFDLVVMDPPTISKSKSMKQDLIIQNDYIWMLNAILKSVSKKGVVYFSCNLSNFKFDANQIQATKADEITLQTIPPDFSGKTPHKCFRLVK